VNALAGRFDSSRGQTNGHVVTAWNRQLAILVAAILAIYFILWLIRGALFHPTFDTWSLIAYAAVGTALIATYAWAMSGRFRFK
jgi:hypothetical protein